MVFAINKIQMWHDKENQRWHSQVNDRLLSENGKPPELAVAGVKAQSCDDEPR